MQILRVILLAGNSLPVPYLMVVSSLELIIHSLRDTSLILMGSMFGDGFLNLLGFQLNGYTIFGMHQNLYFKLLALSLVTIILFPLLKLMQQINDYKKHCRKCGILKQLQELLLIME